jgi:ribonuclease VapC
MITDTSAIVAILFAEPEAEHFARVIIEADHCRLSAASFVELAIVVERQLGTNGSRQLDVFLKIGRIEIEPVSAEQAHIARQAYLDFGKGRHPAALNFIDCFAYALAKAMREPLLFKGNDFSKTDIVTAT